MIKKFIKIYLVIIIGVFSVTAISVFAASDTYVPLERTAFPGITTAGTSGNLGTFLSQVFNWGIAVAVALALIMIIWGGIEYMTTDSWQNKENGMSRIKDALWGLGLALGAYLILYTINPCLVVFVKGSACHTTNTFLSPTGS
jgi:hypothetical protein